MAAALLKEAGRGVVVAGVGVGVEGGVDVLTEGGVEVVTGGALVGVGARVEVSLVHAAVASTAQTAASGRLAAHMCPSCRV
ncbi:hypothetical protein AB0F43_24360 [Kribbella sp. NPDC023972]|uniref:hypothetical protein n=1 Tax=Kribbella sp. NPDC023972 TaxID=3154795 RepID=UPI0033FA1990